MNTGLLIIADDLSGAADCAAGFAQRLPTAVLLDPAGTAHQQVIALDLDSRRLPPDDAARVNRAALENPAYRKMALYKKIDSTLRGNVVAEVVALIARGMALVAPAFPAMGRSTRGGVQHVDGIPVDRSDVWTNEGLTGSASLLQNFRNVGLRCALLDRDALYAAELHERLQAHVQNGTQVLICDAETDEDLRVLAQASADLHERLFWVGSAGLAQHLPDTLSLPHHDRHALTPVRSVLTVVGSMSRHSQAQAERLAESSGQHWERISPGLLLDPTVADAREALSERLGNMLAKGQDLLVSLDQTGRDPANAARLGTPLAKLLLPAIGHAGALVATGGETARALLRAAEIGTLQVHGELATGVVLSSATFNARDLLIVTKAGGFGQPDTLHQAWTCLREGVSNAAIQERIPHDNKEETHHV